jgi:hypothetical protein
VTRRRLIWLLALVALLAALGLGVRAWLAGGSERVARAVEARLGEALGADCRVATAKILSPREVELEGLGCVFEEGGLVGFGIGRAFAEFERPPLSDSLPPVARVEVDDLQVRLAELALPTDEEAGDDDSAGSSDGSGRRRLERETLRFLAFTDDLDQGRGGESVPAVRDRLTTDGMLQVERASIEASDGTVLLSDVHAVVERSGDELAVAVAAQLGTGGLVALDGKLSEAGLREARIRLEELPISTALSSLGGDGLEVRDGLIGGDLRYTPHQRGGAWSADVGFDKLVLRQELLGNEWLPLPAVRIVGTVAPDRDVGMLELEDGEWSVDGEGGAISARFGPLGGDEEATFDLQAGASHLGLGHLLGSLPETLMPASWAEEIQGTFDFELTFGGPLYRRQEWDLDWKADFSRTLLAEGVLASEVARLLGPFEHTFPGDPPVTRMIGPEDPGFVPIREISSHLVNAVVSTEDSGFFAHSGFSEASLKEALLVNLREGEGRGASTITQQLAKNLFLSGERTFARKLKEAVIAWRLESDLPKERILEIYLNIAEWGPGLYGARDAADHYFARTPRVLRPEEAAFLASLLPSPVRYHGYYHGGRGLTENRYTMVQDILRSMHQMGRLGSVDYHLARGEPIEFGPCNLR